MNKKELKTFEAKVNIKLTPVEVSAFNLALNQEQKRMKSSKQEALNQLINWFETANELAYLSDTELCSSYYSQRVWVTLLARAENLSI